MQSLLDSCLCLHISTNETENCGISINFYEISITHKLVCTTYTLAIRRKCVKICFHCLSKLIKEQGTNYHHTMSVQ